VTGPGLLKQAPGATRDRTEAVRFLKKALDLDLKFAEAYFELGKIYFNEEKYPQVIAAWEIAVALRKTFAEAYYRLGRAYAMAGDKQKAQEAFDLSLKQQKALETQVIERAKDILRFVYTLK